MSDQQTVAPAAIQIMQRRRNQMADYLTKRTDQLGRWAAKGLDPASLVRFAMLEWQQNKQLQEATPDSMYLALIACAQVGLEPSGIKQEAFIVPYRDWKTKVVIAQFQPGWRGLIKLARRSREVKSIKAHVVYTNDHFKPMLGSEEYVVHEPVFGDRGEIKGTYALAKMDNGEIEVELMPLVDLEKIREHAKKGDKESPAYREWADQMYRKAPIRRLCKRLPLGEDYFRAARLDEAVESGDLTAYRNALDVGDEMGALLPEAEEPRPLVAVPVQVEDGPAVVQQQQPEPPARGAAAASQQIKAAQSKKSKAPAPVEVPPVADAEPPDELSVAIADIRAELERSADMTDEQLMALAWRIGGLPVGDDKVALSQLWEQAKAARGGQP